jgi:hypothetical protein
MKIVLTTAPGPRATAVLVVLLGIAQMSLAGGNMDSVVVVMVGIAYGYLLATGTSART